MERAETGFDDLRPAADAKDVRVEPSSPRRLRVRPDICDIARIVFQWVSARYEDDLFSHFRVDCLSRQYRSKRRQCLEL